MKVTGESEVAQSCLTQRPHRLQPTRLLHPWDFPGRSTGVGCYCLLQLLELLKYYDNHSILNLNTETGNILLLKLILKYNAKSINFYKDRAVTSSSGQPPN